MWAYLLGFLQLFQKLLRTTKMKSLWQAFFANSKIVVRLNILTVPDLNGSRIGTLKKLIFTSMISLLFAWESNSHRWSSKHNPAGQKILKIVKLDFCYWSHIPHLLCWFVINCDGFPGVPCHKSEIPEIIIRISVEIENSVALQWKYSLFITLIAAL